MSDGETLQFAIPALQVIYTTFTFTFYISDGVNTVSQSLTFGAINKPPYISLLPLKEQKLYGGNTYIYKLPTFVDPENQLVTVILDPNT
jgi:hypothetical protein